MSKDTGSREGFIGRWSRRKLTPEDRPPDEPQSVPLNADARAEQDDPFACFDFESLDFASDYRRFMDAAVPDHVRTKALQRLWTSSEVIYQPDELDDFLEDFRDEAKALPTEFVRSAYKIGRGFGDATASGGPAAADDAASEADETTESQPCPADAPRDEVIYPTRAGEPGVDGTVVQHTQQPSEEKG